MMNSKRSYNHSVSVCSYESIKPKAAEIRKIINIDAVCEELKSFGTDTLDVTSDGVFETNYDAIDWKCGLREYDVGHRSEPRRTLEKVHRNQWFDAATTDDLKWIPTEGSLQVLSLLTSQGNESEQLYTIPVNHRQVSFDMAVETLTNNLYRRVNGKEYNTRFGITRFDAGGNTIALFPYQEVSGDYDGDGATDERLELTTNYNVELENDVNCVSMKLNNTFGTWLDADGFESLLRIFGIVRHEDNIGHPVDLRELIEFFSIIKDVNLGDRAGIEAFCSLAGLEISVDEDLSDENLHCIRNKIGRVLRQLTPVRFAFLEGGHRMSVVNMVSKGVFHPNHCGVKQNVLLPRHGCDIPMLYHDSAVNVKTRFDVYNMHSTEYSFKEAVEKVLKESHKKAEGQKGTISTNPKDELAQLVQDLIYSGGVRDLRQVFFADRSQELYYSNRLAFTGLLRQYFTGGSVPKLPELARLLLADSVKERSKNTSLEIKTEDLLSTLEARDKRYKHVMCKALTARGFSRPFQTSMQLCINTLQTKNQMIQLRRYLSMASKPIVCQRERSDQPDGVLSQKTKSEYRDLEYMHIHFIQRVQKDMSKRFFPFLHLQFLEHGVIKPSDLAKKYQKTALERNKFMFEVCFRSHVQELLLQTINEYGEDMAVSDPVLNFLLKYEISSITKSPDKNVFMERETKSGTEECTAELINKLLVTMCKEAFSSKHGGIVVNTPWAAQLVRSDPFGVADLGTTFSSQGVFLKGEVTYEQFIPQFMNPLVIAKYLSDGGNVGYYFLETLEAVALGVDRKCTDRRLNMDPTTEPHQMICEALRIFECAKDIHASYSNRISQEESEYKERSIDFGEYLLKNVERLESIKRGDTPQSYASTRPKPSDTESDDTAAPKKKKLKQKQKSKRPAADGHEEEEEEDTARTTSDDKTTTAVKLNKVERSIIDETASISQDCAFDFLSWARKPFSTEVPDDTRRLFLMFATRLSLVDKIRINNKQLLELVKEEPKIFDRLSRKIERANISVGIVSDQSSASDENQEEDKPERKRKKKRRAQKQTNVKRVRIEGERTTQDPPETIADSIDTLLSDELCELVSNIALMSFKNEFYDHLGMCDLRMVPRSDLLATLPVGMDLVTYIDTLGYYRSDIEQQLDELTESLDVIYDSRRDPFLEQLFSECGVVKEPILFEASSKTNQGRRTCIRMLALKCMRNLLGDVHKSLDWIQAINGSITILKEDVLEKQWRKDLESETSVDAGVDMANLIVINLNEISEMSGNISKRIGNGIERLLVVKRIVCRWNEWISNAGANDQVMNDLVIDLEECEAAASGIVMTPLRHANASKRCSTTRELLSLLHSLTNVDLSKFDGDAGTNCNVKAARITNWKGAKQQARSVESVEDIRSKGNENGSATCVEDTTGSERKESGSAAYAKDTTGASNPDTVDGSGAGQSTNEFDKKATLPEPEIDFMADCLDTLPMTEEDLLAMIES